MTSLTGVASATVVDAAVRESHPHELAGLFRGEVAAATGGGLDGQRAPAAHLASDQVQRARARTRTSSSPHSTRTLVVGGNRRKADAWDSKFAQRG